ncbi:MAG: hypothetical protein Q7R85_04095 [bacterium]|nr:hypothetical protein [bacterium]
MPTERPQFTGPGDEWQARKEDARLHAEIDEFEQRGTEYTAYIKETKRFLDWIGGMLSRHAVGKEPGRHLDQFSTIYDLIEFAGRDAAEEIDGRHNYEGGNNISAMISKLKDEKFMPSEAKHIGELYDLLQAQLDENEKKIKKMREQEHQE